MSDFPNDAIFYLMELGEPEDNALRIVVAEAKTEGPLVQIPELNTPGRAIEVLPSSLYFELIWEHYVAYSVTNESYAWAQDDRPKGAFVERSSSQYLKFVTEATFADFVLQQPLRHWDLVCLNHCVDVVSVEPPVVRQISAPSIASCD